MKMNSYDALRFAVESIIIRAADAINADTSTFDEEETIDKAIGALEYILWDLRYYCQDDKTGKREKKDA